MAPGSSAKRALRLCASQCCARSWHPGLPQDLAKLCGPMVSLDPLCLLALVLRVGGLEEPDAGGGPL
eukprot:9442673-Alexandrium_andersonii.AAC.1